MSGPAHQGRRSRGQCFRWEPSGSIVLDNVVNGIMCMLARSKETILLDLGGRRLDARVSDSSTILLCQCLDDVLSADGDPAFRVVA